MVDRLSRVLIGKVLSDVPNNLKIVWCAVRTPPSQLTPDQRDKGREQHIFVAIQLLIAAIVCSQSHKTALVQRVERPVGECDHPASPGSSDKARATGPFSERRSLERITGELNEAEAVAVPDMPRKIEIALKAKKPDRRCREHVRADTVESNAARGDTLLQKDEGVSELLSKFIWTYAFIEHVLWVVKQKGICEWTPQSFERTV